jgi:tRNA (adenine22-N1)-methyltransferase
MELSVRLNKIISLVDRCNNIADIGTDHGYIPIYLIKNNLCNGAIASDINLGPKKKAELNIGMEGLSEKIQCRLGGGLNTIKPYEVQAVIIAGMGGYLIRDILEDRLDVFKSLDYAILQPAQNPEILRKYIYERGFKIIDEELCFDQNKYYETIKVAYDNKPKIEDDFYYEVSKTFIEKKHPLIEDYVKYKLLVYIKIYEEIKDGAEAAQKRKAELKLKIDKLKELLLCL